MRRLGAGLTALSLLALGACTRPAPSAAPEASIHEITIGVAVEDVQRAEGWYRDVLGRPVESMQPVEGMVELMVAPGAWLQLFPSEQQPFEPSTAIVRFKTDDIEADASRLRAKGIEVGEVTRIPGVVSFAEFADPFGNPVGLYQLDG